MADETITIETTGSVAVVTLNIAEITFNVSEKLQADVTALIGEQPGLAVVLDLSALKFLGSLGLTTLVVLLKRLREARGRFLVAGLAGQRLRVVELMRMTKVFDLHPDVPSAMAALQPAKTT